jgi:hypothetical protein
MKKLLFVFLLCASLGRAADGVDAFRNGLQAFQTNGVDALIRTLYSTKNPAEVEGLKQRLAKASAGLGQVFDTEVFAPRAYGKNVQRLYGVIYFAEHPLWVRADYYSINGRSGFISMEFSRHPEDVLPLEIGMANR